LGDPKGGTRTHRKQYASFCKHHAFVSFVEPTTIDEALGEPDWILAMQDELNNFTRNQVWELVECPKNKNVIGTKWVYWNKQDVSVRKVVPTLTSKSVEIYLSMDGAKRLGDTILS
jgi:hypothetical protein